MTEIETTKSSKLETTKTIARFIAVRAVSGVVVTLAHQNLDTTDFSRSQRAGVYVGAYLIGSMVADKAADHVSEKIDMVAKLVSELKNDYKSETETDTTN